jgi:hypothetical protein
VRCCVAVPVAAGGAWAGDACALVAALCGRESIFLFSHTNEFCGKSKVAPEPRVAWTGLKWGRRVCERGQPRKQVKRLERVPPAGRCHCGGVQRTNLENNVPYLEETLCGAPSTACRLRSSPAESHHWESPPTKSAASALHGVLGMPQGGGRLVLPPPKDGLCGWLADG